MYILYNLINLLLAGSNKDAAVQLEHKYGAPLKEDTLVNDIFLTNWE